MEIPSVEELAQFLEDPVRKIGILMKMIDDLRRFEMTTNHTIKQLESANKKLKDENFSLRTRLESYSDQHDRQLFAEITELRVQISESELTNYELSEENDKLKQTISTQSDSIKSLNTEIQQLRQQLDTIKSQPAPQPVRKVVPPDDQIIRLRERNKHQKGTISNLNSEIRNLKSKLETAESKTASQTDKLLSSEKQVQNLNKIIQNIRAENADLIESNRKQSERLEKVRDTVRELNLQITAQKAEIERLQMKKYTKLFLYSQCERFKVIAYNYGALLNMCDHVYGSLQFVLNEAELNRFRTQNIEIMRICSENLIPTPGSEVDNYTGYYLA